MIAILLAAALLADGPAAAPEAKKDPNEIVCKREKVAGSNMKQRVCMTVRQWEDRREQDKEMLDDAQRRQPMKG